MSGPTTDLSGRKLGEYELVARVGVGGMGEVYEGRHPLIGKRVAVKVLLPSLSNEAELVERFLSEARAVNEIRHRGIVDIFSFGQLPEGARYFVMEFLEGEAFDKIIKKRAPMPIVETLGWADEMLDALDAAHAAGIIHRDIKPSNLFLVNTGRGRPYVKLLDFGIAKLGAIQGEATPQTRASVILGTPDYISPEQARGRPISPQTDLYAIGCVLFEMLTGQRVFVGENTLQTMWMHVEDTPPVPSSIRPDIPPELDRAILWALEKESTHRPPSAAVLREHLLAIRNSLAPSGQFTPPPTTASGAHPVINARTPAPSGRSRPVGTPAPRSGSQAPLKTPHPGAKSGGQSSLSGRTRAEPKHVPSPAETRMAPLTAMTGASPLESGPPSLKVHITEEHEVPAEEPIQAPKSKLPLVLAGAVVVLVLAIVGYFALGSGSSTTDPSNPVPIAETPPKVDPPKVDPPKQADPPKVDPPPSDPVAVVQPPPENPPKQDPPKVDPPKQDPPTQNPPKQDPPTQNPPKQDPAPKPDPVQVKPKTGKVITTEQLIARYKKIEARLAAKEAETGQRDNVLRQFLEATKKAINSATTDADKREVWGTLGEIEGQIR